MIWIGVFGTLAMIFAVWMLASGRRAAPPPAAPSVPKKDALPAAAKAAKKTEKTEKKKADKAEAAGAVPPSTYDEEDDVEITLVRAALPADVVEALAAGKPLPASEKPAEKEKEKAKSDLPILDLKPKDEEGDGEDVEFSTAPMTTAFYPEDEPEAALDEPTMPVTRILVSAHAQTDQGLVRRRNEDSFLVQPEHGIYAVADGMGGYAGGKVASELAVAELRKAFDSRVFDTAGPLDANIPRRGAEVAAAVQIANAAVFAKARAEPALAHMGTTVVCARFSPDKQRVYIAHVGDSRVYRLRNGNLRRLTTDHTMRHLGFVGPGSEHLYRAVGIRPSVDIDLIVDKPRPEDAYLLCSDGLTKMAKDDDIARIMNEHLGNVEAMVYSLIEIANDRGGKDNVTCVIVKVVERDAVEQILPGPTVDLEG